MPSVWKRIVCRVLGHRWYEQRRGAPVTEFLCCARCRKVGDRIKDDE